MRKGGSPAKGAAWERAVGKELSLWLTNNERDDILTRNATSGAAFTIALGKGKKTSRMPGDLMAAHPLAFEFLNKIAVECKHLRTLALENYLFDDRGTSPLTKITCLATEQAMVVGLVSMIIAKQNRRDPLVIVSSHVGELLLKSRRPCHIAPTYHVLHRNSVFVARLRDIVLTCDPKAFLDSFFVPTPVTIPLVADIPKFTPRKKKVA